MKVLQVSQNLFVRGGSDRMFLDTCSLLQLARPRGDPVRRTSTN